MNFVSLFAGIGGLDVGLERAGMSCVAQVEKDPYCLRVLAKHWPQVARFDDVRTFGRNSIPHAVDLICGGFPCQPHSLAGSRRASEDERDLWAEFARIIGEFKPRWVLAENVPGLLSSEDGRFFGRVLRDLAALRFHVEWDCIPAASIGAPHLRDRVFIVAHDARRSTQGSVFGTRYSFQAFIKARRLRGLEERVKAWNGTMEAIPVLVREANGVSSELDRARLRALGNAVVPQVAEHLGKLIMEADALEDVA